MKPKLPPSSDKAGQCKQDPARQECPLVCKYNHFQSDDLEINAWELKCLDCGWRDTVGFRSDEMDEDDEDVDPTQCPFCQIKGCKPGADCCEKTQCAPPSDG